MLSDRDYMRPGAPASAWHRPALSVVKPLIWTNVLVFVVTGFGQDTNAFFGLLHLHPYFLRVGQVWRLGTYMFVHGGFGHIFFNMWGLYLFGRLVEDRLGPQRFLRLYLLSGVLGGLAWLLTCWDMVGAYDLLQDGRALRAIVSSPSRVLAAPGVEVLHAYGGVVGASGAVFGVMMAAAMTAPNLRIMLLLPPVPMKLKTFVAFYALIEVAMAWYSAVGQTRSRIAHLAHLGGLVGAFLYMRHLGHVSPWGFLRGLREAWRARRARRRSEPVSGGTGPIDLSAAGIDRILDKIGREGMQSLTEDERRILLEAGRRFRDSQER